MACSSASRYNKDETSAAPSQGVQVSVLEHNKSLATQITLPRKPSTLFMNNSATLSILWYSMPTEANGTT